MSQTSSAQVHPKRAWWPVLALAVIIALGAFLRFYQLGAYSVGNQYYAATVQSMLTSWRNFFFVAFEPGGSVTVDKPPLGFWLQALSAYFLGVNGFALALPQALAGVLSIPLLYNLIKQPFGAVAGLIAAATLAVIPVTIATERNNTIDGTLVFVLLCAVWAVWHAIQSGKFRYLLLSALLVGVGFNIKMLQAYMVLPAIYAVYLLGAPHGWLKRVGQLGLATVLLVAVSLAWAVAVDAVPASERPFIGSSQNNTVMELITGHNGLSRLGFGNSGPGGPPPDGQRPADGPQNIAQDGPPPPNGGDDGRPGGGGPGGMQEVGQAGALRLFTAPLAEEASWFLPFALLGLLAVVAVLGWRWPLSAQHLALVLWAGWLLPMVLYFSFNSGLWHTYYLIMVGPGLAAVVAMSAWALGQILQRHHWTGWSVLAALTGVNLAFELGTLWQYPQYAVAVTVISIGAWVLGLALLAARRTMLTRFALALVCVSLIAAPLTFAALTTFNTQANVGLPNASPEMGQPRPAGQASGTPTLSATQQTVLDYLVANTAPGSYLAATVSANEAAPYILATQRAVLTFGGFSGGDNVVNPAQLAQRIASGELRFVLDAGQMSRNAEMGAWVNANCSVVDLPGVPRATATQGPGVGPGGGGPQAITVYDCGATTASQ